MTDSKLKPATHAGQAVKAHEGQLTSMTQGKESSTAVALQGATGGGDDSNASSMISSMQAQASQEMAANDAMTEIGNQVSMEAAKNNLKTAMQDAMNNTMKGVGSSIKSATAAG